MTLVEQSRQAIIQTIQELPAESLDELRVFVAYLQHKRQYPGSAWMRTLYDLFAPAREGATQMTEPEIDQLIAEEVKAARTME